LTALGAVSRVYTNLAVLDVGADGFVVRDIVPGLDLTGLQALTGARLHTA
jgi:acyl CoA:acetate/3-ketoacid CoA transferase beta subunit